MKRKIDWLQLGQLLAHVNGLWTMVKSEFINRKIGAEILEWMNGPGRAFVQNEFLPKLPEQYLQWREKQKLAVGKYLVAEVDLDKEPETPFHGAILKWHLPMGKNSKVEYRPDEDELYLNGKKVVLFLSENQKNGLIKGTDLAPEAQRNFPINATFLGWLSEHQEFIPKKWQGKNWFFWGAEWSDSDGRRCVRYLGWDGSRWIRRYGWLENDWSALVPSASLAS